MEVRVLSPSSKDSQIAFLKVCMYSVGEEY